MLGPRGGKTLGAGRVAGKRNRGRSSISKQRAQRSDRPASERSEHPRYLATPITSKYSECTRVVPSTAKL